ncbi:hypothetical protein ACWA6H_25675 [Pseudomonas bijieensis]|jgi:hypothetical protein|uniref:hypothetical protein n=1 Tax=Pseudomonas TaxID=286 RepID=UPI000D6D191F|nr:MULTISPECIES: hypothetical protein [Pseudomonas]AXP05366.1 hypothetical protein DZG01_21335 [Pseudomonas fluorescens]PWJ28845.1 hypothetical protein ATJ40_120102 [Pseudomonas sp. 43mfcvi1.1]UQI30415.1 hypothetical protein M3M50_26420 [Pseudomonas bijieensis]SSB99784.1 hypothetical protein SAMN04488697_120102 [Pseudomonas sp. 43mfcvi1.1]
MDSENSFHATLDMFSAHVNLLERLHGKPALATVSSFSGGFYTGKPQTQDHSHLLGMRAEDPRTRGEPLRLHFRHTANGYILTLKNTGEHYNKVLSKSWFEVLGAKDPNTKKPTLFTLIDFQQNVITPKNIKSGHTRISLMTANKKHVGGLRLRGSPYLYLAETEEQSKATFILSIL